MKKIIVAGAGHGGIAAALNLARAGYDVTVYEKNKREDLGYDWVDVMCKNVFNETGFPCPHNSVFDPMVDQGYYSPAKTEKIVVREEHDERLGYIERKYLINYIIDFAGENGVKFVFSAEILCALYDNNRVTGIKISENGTKKDIFGDMVIDAAGMDSPVRGTLPEKFGVRRQAHFDETFCTWRASFKKTEQFHVEPKNTIYFFHCGKKGMDWAINDEESIDILIGGFGKLTKNDIDKALEDFFGDYPIEHTPIRGGCGDNIPLGRMLSVMVCNGYAAVGNSAFMTEPLSGSGIDLSMSAGKLLADTIIDSDGDFSVRSLWKYNYMMFKKYGEFRYNNIIIKSFLSFLTPDDIDFLFQKKILTAKEIGNYGKVRYKLPELISKANILKKPKIIIQFTEVLKKIMLLDKLKRDIPEAYNKTAVEKWQAEYSRLR